MPRWFWSKWLCILVLMLPALAQARDVVQVNSVQMLRSTLKQAAPRLSQGLTIELAPGTYQAVKLHTLEASARAPLILRSADKTRPARLSGLSIQQARHIIVENLVLDYNFGAGDPLHLRPFHVRNSAYVTLRNNVFDGDLVRSGATTDVGFPTAQGLNVRNASNITIQGNEIHRFYRGLVFREVRNLLVRSNDLHSLRSDGMNFAQVQKVVIENNYIHDFRRSVKSKDHADMIQFWTNKTSAPSRDITIHNNVLNSGHGAYSQSILMRNEEVDNGRAGLAMFYQNIRITQNVVINAHLIGIRVGETDGLVIANNSVLRNARSEGAAKNPGLWTPQIRVSAQARNVQIKANVTAKVHGYTDQRGWVVTDNFIVQDRARGKPGFYTRVFRNPLRGDPRDLNSFKALPGGPLSRGTIGAARLR